MTTFEQYLSSEETIIDVSEMLQAPPYNFTWYNTGGGTDSREVGHQKTQDCTQRRFGAKGWLLVNYRPHHEMVPSRLTIEAPGSIWNSSMNRTTQELEDLMDTLTTSKFFFTDIYEYENVDDVFMMKVPMNWVDTFDPWLHADFDVYRYYQGLPSDNEEKRRIHTIEYGASKYWRNETYYNWCSSSDKLLLKLKRKYLGEESITPEDLVRGAMHDI